MSKDEPTNGELKLMLDFLKETILNIESTGKDTNQKATYTNGRVTKLEDAVKVLSEIIQKHNDTLYNDEKGIVPTFQRIKGAIISWKVIYPISIILVSTLGGLYVYKIKNEIISETRKQAYEISYEITNKVFDERVAKLEVDK